MLRPTLSSGSRPSFARSCWGGRLRARQSCAGSAQWTGGRFPSRCSSACALTWPRPRCADELCRPVAVARRRHGRSRAGYDDGRPGHGHELRRGRGAGCGKTGARFGTVKVVRLRGLGVPGHCGMTVVSAFTGVIVNDTLLVADGAKDEGFSADEPQAP